MRVVGIRSKCGSSLGIRRRRCGYVEAFGGNAVRVQVVNVACRISSSGFNKRKAAFRRVRRDARSGWTTRSSQLQLSNYRPEWNSDSARQQAPFPVRKRFVRPSLSSYVYQRRVLQVSNGLSVHTRHDTGPYRREQMVQLVLIISKCIEQQCYMEMSDQ